MNYKTLSNKKIFILGKNLRPNTLKSHKKLIFVKIKRYEKRALTVLLRAACHILFYVLLNIFSGSQIFSVNFIERHYTEKRINIRLS
jgi:hypothetical protein